jgi:hypothetical protein
VDTGKYRIWKAGVISLGLSAISTRVAMAGCAGLIVSAGAILQPVACSDPPVCTAVRPLKLHYVCISDANFDAQTSSYGAYNGTGWSAAVGSGGSPCPPNSFPVFTGSSQ